MHNHCFSYADNAHIYPKFRIKKFKTGIENPPGRQSGRICFYFWAARITSRVPIIIAMPMGRQISQFCTKPVIR